MGRVRVCILFVGNSEERDRGVGTSVNATMLSETQEVVGLAEASRRAVRLRKKPMDLCACDREQSERGVGAGVNATILSETLQVVGLTEAPRREVRL